MCFIIFSSEKTPFWAVKTKSWKSQKIKIFPNGLVHGFGSKFAIFPCLFLGNLGQENVFYDILEKKKPYLGYKNEKVKKSKNWVFSKGVSPWFWVQNCVKTL